MPAPRLVRDIRGQDHTQVPLRLPSDMKELVDQIAPELLMDRMTLMRVAIVRLLRDLGYAYPPRR